MGELGSLWPLTWSYCILCFVFVGLDIHYVTPPFPWVVTVEERQVDWRLK